MGEEIMLTKREGAADTKAAGSAIKELLGKKAAGLVSSGCRVGLGTGTTAAWVIRELGRRVREEQLQIRCVATSLQSALLARQVGLAPELLHGFSEIDISIDGADEIDPEYNLIKGGGGAHTLEKLVHAISRRFVVVADPGKLVKRLGEKSPLPVEVLPEAISFVMRQLELMGASQIWLRNSSGSQGPSATGNGNYIVDALLKIEDPRRLEQEINLIPGVVDNGIFAHIRPEPSDCITAL